MKSTHVDTYHSSAASRLNGVDRPIILVLQGVEIDKDEYAPLAHELAGVGFDVVVPNFVAPSGDYICADPTSVARFLSSTETVLPEIRDSLESGFTLLGHSAGGMAAFSALAAESPTLDTWPAAIVTYGSNAPRLDDLQRELPPTLMMSGLKDMVVPPHITRSGFQNLPLARKSLLSLLRFHHYSITASGAPEGAPKENAMGTPCGRHAAGILAKIIRAFVISACTGKPKWEESLDAEVAAEIDSLQSV